MSQPRTRWPVDVPAAVPGPARPEHTLYHERQDAVGSGPLDLDGGLAVLRWDEPALLPPRVRVAEEAESEEEDAEDEPG